LIQEQLDLGRSARDVAATLCSALGIRKKTIYDLAVSLVRQKRV